jgi:type VI secretion system protein ImpH
MAAPRGQPRPSLIEALYGEPRRFGFFQAVRILEWVERKLDPRRTARAAVGTRADPHEEVVRFRAQQSLSFPTTEIEALETHAEGSDRTRPGGPPEMTVSFFGLTGPSGVLPLHYTALVVRSVRQKSYALRDFFDVFNHRLVALFLRAGTKYRLPLAYERSAQPGADPVSTVLRGIVGLGTKSVQNRTRTGDETVLHYAGLYGHFPRSAAGLEAVLSDYFARAVQVEQFFGRWIALAPGEQTALPSRELPDGAYGKLGADATIGARAWDVQGSFRLHIGPLDYDQFLKFMPDGEDLTRLVEMTELYVGPHLVFDVKLTLRREAVPRLGLADGDGRPRLGWNSWLATVPPPHHVSDAVFLMRRI